MFRPIFLLCLLFPIQLVTAVDWYAVFYNSTLKTQLNQTFLSYVKLTENDTSANEFQCDHTTIAYNPANPSPYIPRLGEKHSAHILAYAHDEHGQAILVRYDGVNAIPTTNAYPHTTISDTGVGLYSAVYSNDLWARVNASGVVSITLAGGFPDTISFTDTTNVVNNTLDFTLPQITIGAKTYTASRAQVTIQPPETWFTLEGIFCVNSGWDGAVCTPPASASSSSSSSSSTGPSLSSTGASSSSSSSSSTAGLNPTVSSSSTGSASPSPSPSPVPVPSGPNWYAVFYNATLKSRINQTFLSYVQITPNDHSANEFQCDHTTIAYNPSNPSPYIPRLGEKQSAHILGYAHDEHGQALLLRYGGVNPIPTLNSFPHATLSDENVGPYGAVYSNDLWARVNASGFVNITFSGGFPSAISFKDMTNVVNNTLTFPLPQIKLGAKTYNATTVQVIIQPPGTWFELEGIFCVNVGWDGSVCTPPPVSSSSSSSSTGVRTSSSSTGVNSASIMSMSHVVVVFLVLLSLVM